LASTILAEIAESNYDFFVTANKYKISQENIDIGTLDLEKIKEVTQFDGEISAGLASEVIAADGVGNFSFDNGYWIVE
jgi:predicted RecB family endonuclease